MDSFICHWELRRSFWFILTAVNFTWWAWAQFFQTKHSKDLSRAWFMKYCEGVVWIYFGISDNMLWVWVTNKIQNQCMHNRLPIRVHHKTNKHNDDGGNNNISWLMWLLAAVSFTSAADCNNNAPTCDKIIHIRIR